MGDEEDDMDEENETPEDLEKEDLKDRGMETGSKDQSPKKEPKGANPKKSARETRPEKGPPATYTPPPPPKEPTDPIRERHPLGMLGLAFLIALGIFIGVGSVLPMATIPLLGLSLVVLGYFTFFNTPGIISHSDPTTRKGTRIITVIMGSFGMILLLVLLLGSLIVVPAGHKGVLVTTPAGNSFDEINEGWSFSPYYLFCSREIIRYNTQQEGFVGNDESNDNAGSIMVSSQDNVGIYVDFSIVYHIDPDKVADLRIEAGDYKQSVLIPVARSVPRDVCAQYNALQIRGEARSVVEQGIRDNITLRLAEKYIQVEIFALRDIRLPAQYEAAIVQKKVAEQNVITQQYNLEAQQFIANQTIINALAVAEAVKINASAQANATVLMADGRAQAIALVMARLNSTAGNSTTDYLRFLYISALSDPNSHIQFVAIPTEGGVPILIQLPQEKQ